MEPRRHRLGDVVDDYCPRERRLSNHVIVAIVDDLIKQTRCSTCDFEHPFKEGKVPAKRARKDSTSALYKQVLENVTEGTGAEPTPRAARRVNGVAPPPEVIDEAPRPALVAPRPVLARPEPRPEPPPLTVVPPPAPPNPPPAHDEGPVHRTLIRATLPKIEGEPREPRPIPTFTVREAATRPKFRRFPRPAGARNAQPYGHGGQPSPFTAQPRGPGGNFKGPGPQGNRAGGHPHGNRPNQRRGNKGR